MNLDRIGKYRIVDRIGQGAMGEVFKAHDPLLNRYVALKTISPALAGDSEFRQRFQREAQSAARLNHPNIVTIYDFGSDDTGLTYMAMELLEGVDLREAIRQRSLGTILKRLDLMEQVCDGLAFAHARGVVHRDLKPGNIHLQPTGQIKILDFGLARLSSSDMTKTGTVMGTPHYMSPEQVRGQKADARSDVFSLGAVFYELLTGKRAFDGRSVPEVLQAITRDDPEPVRRRAPDTPPSLSAIVERALSRDADRRFADAGEMRRALAEARDVLAGETLVTAPETEATVVQEPGATFVTAPPPVDGSTALDPRRRSGIGRREPGTVRPDPTWAVDPTELQPAAPNRTLLIAGGAALVLVAAGGGFLWLRSRAPQPPAAGTVAAGTAQEKSVLTEALLSGKVELARADLENQSYTDAVAHAREALEIDPTSTEAQEVLERAQGIQRDVEAAVTSARGALAKGDTAAASEAFNRLLNLDRHHPAVAGLVTELNRFSRRQAEEARSRAAAARTAAGGDAQATRVPLYAQGQKLTTEADALFGQDRFAEAAQKYVESRAAFDAAKRDADSARQAEAARQEAARQEAARQAEAQRLAEARAAEARAAAARTTATPRPTPTTVLPTAAPSPTAVATAQPGASGAAAGAATTAVRDSPDAAVRRAIADYGRAIETQDLDLFRTVKPDLSADEERKLRDSFKAVRYDRVGIDVESVDVSGSEAVANVTSQYTVNGREQKPQKLAIRLARSGSSWRIVSMGPR